MLILIGVLLPWVARAEPGTHAPPTAAGGARTAWREDADAYCRFVTAVAESESALLVAPRLLGSFGVVQGEGAADEAHTLRARPRLTVGVSYSGADLHRGLLLRERARAECARHRAASQLLALLAAGEGLPSREAQLAKLRVLEAALPRAQELLGSTRAAAEQAWATVEELHDTEMRVDRLRAEAAEARRQVELAVAWPRVDLDGLVRTYSAAEAEMARHDAAIRRSYGWDVTVQGGYSQVFGAREDVPLFGAISVSWSPGLLFQRDPDSRAVAGRSAAALRDVNGLPARVEQLRLRARAARRAERLRLDEAAALLAGLEATLASVEAVKGERARRYADQLWFDVVRVRTEHEYLRVHVEELTALLGNEGAR